MSDQFAYGWSIDVARYVDLNTGRFVSKDLVLNVMQGRIDESLGRLSDMAASLLAGDVDLGDWQNAFIVELRRLYVENGVLGGGGFANMTPAQYGRIGGDLADQYRYLQNFVNEIAKGNLTEGQIITRAKMYGEASKEAFWDTFKDMQASNITDSSLPLLTNTPGDGSTQCLTNCNCDISVDRDGAHWNLNPGEHCDDCQALAAGGPYRLE